MTLPALRTETFHLVRLNIDVTIRELTVRDMQAIAEAEAAPGFVCKCCVVEWQDETVEAIESGVGALTLQDIGAEAYRFTGVELKKNSEPGRNVVSISG